MKGLPGEFRQAFYKEENVTVNHVHKNTSRNSCLETLIGEEVYIKNIWEEKKEERAYAKENSDCRNASWNGFVCHYRKC